MCVPDTYREVSERRPLKASEAMSEIWFLLKSLWEQKREGEVSALVIQMSSNCRRQYTSAEVKGRRLGKEKTRKSM